MGEPTETARRRPRGGGVVLPVAVLVQGWLVVAAATARFVARRARRSEDGVIAEYVAMGAFGVVVAVALWAAMKALGLDVIETMRRNILGEG
ncbi:MAG: hypothetical protein M3P85_02660 [Actinomycetota bacterium]|nr:hypothetical protein [Actinomycetota bacterium]